ncbi:MAG: GDP-mannose 4,6-dehydratase [Ignavibacteriae bacterium]|nr:MAG: GDP-mannose 4,6-dehydratase [Ignavibacteriota bacterium]
MKQKTALIIGIAGQDGSYLAEFLLSKNYRVVGLMLNSIVLSSSLIAHLANKIAITYGDLLDMGSIMETIRSYQPDEIYNLAAQSSPGDSWRLAIETAEITGVGAQRVYEAVRCVKPDCRIYQASSSEMFGTPTMVPQNEHTPFEPVNPYGAAKLYAHSMAQIYSKSYNLFIACGILFNHESPRRGINFLTQKVAYGAACIKLGILNSPDLNEQGEPIVKNGTIALGNLDAKRDWGFAGDYVEAMWMMLQHKTPGTYVIGTGEIRTVRQLCEEAFHGVGLDWKKHVVADQRFIRLTETGTTVADATKAKSELGWSPRTSFADLVKMMVEHQINRIKKQQN